MAMQAQEVGEQTPLLGEQTPRSDSKQKLAQWLKNKTALTSMIGDGVGLGAGAKDKAQGLWDRLFLKHLNRKFGENAELALRAAVFSVVLGAPYLINSSFLNDLRDQGWLSFTAFVMFVFTVYKTLGETISFAYYGMIGTIFSSFSIWTMHGFCPGGYTHDAPMWRFYFGVAYGTIFSLVILWLNFNKLTKVFCLCFYVWHWMGFLNPEFDSKNYSMNFEVRLGGTAVNEFFQSSLGCLLGVLCLLIPFPITALAKARRTAKEVVNTLVTTLEGFAAYICGDMKNLTVVDRISKDMKELRTLVNSIDGYIASSWWECFGFGRSQKIRVAYTILATAILQFYDVLNCMMKCAADEDFGPEHLAFMDHMREPLVAVIAKSVLLVLSIVSACDDGDLDDEERGGMRKSMDDVRKSVAMLDDALKTFRRAKGNKIGNEFKFLVDERTVCLCVARFASIALRAAGELSDDDTQMMNSHSIVDIISVANMSSRLKRICEVVDPAVLFSLSQATFVFKNGISFFLTFWLGYYGHTVFQNMFQPYNADMASTVAILFTSKVGAEMSANLNRLQGLVLGTVAGQMVYATFGWCTNVSFAMTIIIFFFWQLLSLFYYYDSVQFGGIFILLSAFGSKNVLKSCSDVWGNNSSTYFAIVAAVVSISIIICVDLLASPDRASVMANKERKSALEKIQESVKDLFDPDVTVTRFHDGEIQDHCDKAETLCMEAANEPRVWRTEFRSQLFLAETAMILKLRYALTVLEVTMADDFKDGGPKSESFMIMVKSPAFARIRQCIDSKLSQIIRLSLILEHDVDGPMVGKTASCLRDEPEMLSTEFVPEMEQAMLEAEQIDFSVLKDEKLSIEHDPILKLSLVISCCRSMMEVMTDMQHNLLNAI